MQFSCRENKDDMGRRFFHDLEQRVESAGGEHVHLVDDIDPVFADSRGKVCLVPQIADIVDAVVGRRVHFGDVEYRTILDSFADRALQAGVPVYRVQAVDCLGEDFGTGGFTGSSRTGKQVSVGGFARADLILQNRGDVFLRNDIGKELRPPFAVECQIHAAPSSPV